MKNIKQYLSLLLKGRKESLLMIFFALILLSIVITIALVASNTSRPSEPIPPTPTVTPAPVQGSYIFYDAKAGEKLAEKDINRQTLSPADAEAKAHILQTIGGETGLVYQSPLVQILYVKEADLFQAEILTIDIAGAKADANIWLRQQGLSQKAICNLPVMFYLNALLRPQFQGKYIIFSPLPNGCE